MPSIEPSQPTVVVCCGSPEALAELPGAPGLHVCRVAVDEVLLVAPPAQRAEVLQLATEQLAAADATALVLDQSDGWSAFTLRGDDAPSLFAQLSAVPLPEGRPAFAQGAVAGGPAKILVVDGAIHLLVPSTLRHHVATRLHDAVRSRTTIPAAVAPVTSSGAARRHEGRTAAPAPR